MADGRWQNGVERGATVEWRGRLAGSASEVAVQRRKEVVSPSGPVVREKRVVVRPGGLVVRKRREVVRPSGLVVREENGVVRSGGLIVREKTEVVWPGGPSERRRKEAVSPSGRAGTTGDPAGSASDYACLFFGLRAGPGNQDRGGRPSLGLSRPEGMGSWKSVKEFGLPRTRIRHADAEYEGVGHSVKENRQFPPA
jgi:hypothetical protein